MLLSGARDEAPTLSINLQICGTRPPQRSPGIELNVSSAIFSCKLVTLKASLYSLLACNGSLSLTALSSKRAKWFCLSFDSVCVL